MAKSKKHESILVPRKRARAGAPRTPASQASSASFNKRGELVIRDAGLIEQLTRLVESPKVPKRGVAAAEIIVVLPTPPIPPPIANTMCLCTMLRARVRETVVSQPTRGVGRPT